MPDSQPLSHSVSPSYKDAPDMTECRMGSDPEWPTHVLYDQRTYTAELAAEHAKAEFDIEAEPVVEEMWARWLDLQEQWELSSDFNHRWEDDHGEEPPAEPPEGWSSDWEYDPVWTPCTEGDPGAVKCWKIETGLS